MKLTMITLAPILALLIPVSGCGDAEEEKFFSSVPESLEYVRSGGGFGYCVSEHSVSRIVFDYADGIVTVSGRVMVKVPQTDASNSYDTSCPEGALMNEDNTCITDVPFESFRLTDEQLAQYANLVTDLPRSECKIDRDLACDYCQQAQINVDEVRISDACCGTHSDADFPEAFDRIEAFVDGLPLRLPE